MDASCLICVAVSWNSCFQSSQSLKTAVPPEPADSVSVKYAEVARQRTLAVSFSGVNTAEDRHLWTLGEEKFCVSALLKLYGFICRGGF